jgi:hypothetical protein
VVDTNEVSHARFAALVAAGGSACALYAIGEFLVSVFVGGHRIEYLPSDGVTTAVVYAVAGMLLAAFIVTVIAAGRHIARAITGSTNEEAHASLGDLIVIFIVRGVAFTVVCAALLVGVMPRLFAHPRSSPSVTFRDHAWESVGTRATFVDRSDGPDLREARDIVYRIASDGATDAPWRYTGRVLARMPEGATQRLLERCAVPREAGIAIDLPELWPSSWPYTPRVSSVRECHFGGFGGYVVTYPGTDVVGFVYPPQAF